MDTNPESLSNTSQLLHAVGGGVVQGLGELPAVLTLGVAEQPADVPDRVTSRLVGFRVPGHDSPSP